jgi:hypothetical protein
MGYYTYITGGLEISPPIDESKFTEFVGDDSYFTFELVPGDEDVQLINGIITVVGQSAGHTDVNLNFDESIKAYDFEDHVNRLVGRAKSLGHQADGAFYGDGEESEDFWRLGVDNNALSTESGEIVYPSDRYYEIAARGKQSSAHGNVIPRPDGGRAKCGGAPRCTDCQEEREFLTKLLYRSP